MALGRARRSATSTALIFCDLDDFKLVNDSLGHTRGDELLVAIAGRLSEATRPGDTVARFGGDEFVVLAEEIEGADAAEAIAQRLRRAVARPLQIAQSELFVSVSVGIAVADRNGADAEALISDADAAMYRAKATGRGRQVVFDQGLRAEAVERLDTETALQRALDRRELRIHYQPIVELGHGRTVGYEALLRWEHPERGLLLPVDFMRVAEETGLIVPIGAWVARQACGQLARWRAEGAEDTLDGRQPVGPSTGRRGGRGRHRRRHPPGGHPAHRPPGRDHREPPDRERRAGHRHAAAPPRAGGAGRGRRLRHRLLLAHLPRPAAGRHGEARPFLPLRGR